MIDEDIRYSLARMEAKLDILLMGAGKAPSPPPQGGRSEARFLRSLTRRQHITLQALVGGWTNSEIAAALDVNENTAKLHVRTVCQKLGVRNRAEAAVAGADLLSQVSPDEYLAMTGGIPVDWRETAPRDGTDPLKALYPPRKTTTHE